MYSTEHKDPSLIEPADGDSLWRYQTFCKFQSLVQEKALFFCRLDKLKDQREGTLPLATANSIKHFLQIPNKDETIQLSNEITRSNTAVNCWNLSNYEDALMWGNYAKRGVAIRTTFASLKDSLRLSPTSVIGGLVQYIDHDKDEVVRAQTQGQGKVWSSGEMATLKYQSFDGEKEFRLISYLLDKVIDGNTGNAIEPIRTENGIFVNVSLYQLLREVVISPDAESELETKVRTLMEPINNGLPLSSRVPINKSTLYG